MPTRGAHPASRSLPRRRPAALLPRPPPRPRRRPTAPVGRFNADTRCAARLRSTAAVPTARRPWTADDAPPSTHGQPAPHRRRPFCAVAALLAGRPRPAAPGRPRPQPRFDTGQRIEMGPFQRDFEDEYALKEMIQEGTQSAACFQDNQNEDDGSQYLNDTGDGDANTMEEMHVEDDIPEVTGNSITGYERL
ncbi:hypothetical protein PVAP13_3NG181744 [Panicum virgatum]|uniref:Uncharacterized protein n=1 Tax=Panicum virgatum TaxID=38727 RepID=A0A8T0U932_PANVG|nr:hypothetical protein PVAP13_3NG181744 [Panicum virgatum]